MKRNSYKITRMTRGETGGKHPAALQRAGGFLTFENSQDLFAFIHTPFPRCVATTSKKSADAVSHAARSGRLIAAFFACRGLLRGHAKLSIKRGVLRAFSSWFRVRDFTWPYLRRVPDFFVFDAHSLSDNHPALLKMFDRAQAANNLTRVVPHQ